MCLPDLNYSKIEHGSKEGERTLRRDRSVLFTDIDTRKYSTRRFQQLLLPLHPIQQNLNTRPHQLLSLVDLNISQALDLAQYILCESVSDGSFARPLDLAGHTLCLSYPAVASGHMALSSCRISFRCKLVLSGGSTQCTGSPADKVVLKVNNEQTCSGNHRCS